MIGAMSALSACDVTDKDSEGGANTNGKLTFQFYNHGAAVASKTPKYQKEVVNKINEKLQNELGFTVDFKVTIYPDDVFAEKVMLDLASKKQIDLVRITPPTSQLVDLYNKNIIKDLTPYIDKATNLKTNIPESVWKEVSADGKILAIPMPVYQTTVTGWTRNDLLKKVGMEVPKTFSEFESYLKKIKQAEPDKTPYMAPLKNMEQFLLGCFTETPGDFVDSNQQIKPYFYDPGYKAFISKLSEWYKLGLIDDSMFNQNENQIIDIFGKDKTAVAGCNIWQLEYGTLGAINTQKKDWDIKFIEPLSDAKKYPTEGIATEMMYVPVTSKHTEQVIQFCDWLMYNEDNYSLVMNGIEGKTYEVKEENDKKVIVTPQSEGDVALVDLYQSVFVGYNGTFNLKYSNSTTPDEAITAYKVCSSLPLDKMYLSVTNYYNIKLPNDVNMAKGDALQTVAEKLQYMIQGKEPLSNYDKMLKEFEDMGGLEAYKLYTQKMNK